MIIGDLTSGTVLISLILKCVFLGIVIYELVLPRLDPPPDKHGETLVTWKTDLSAELQHAAITGNSFLFSIGLLLGLDYIASEDSWIPLAITIILDILLLGLILVLLYSPKNYAITETGIRHQGLLLKWDHIKTVDHSSTTRLKIKTKDWYRDNPEFPLPRDRDERAMIIDHIEGALARKNGTTESSEHDLSEQKDDANP